MRSAVEPFLHAPRRRSSNRRIDLARALLDGMRMKRYQRRLPLIALLLIGGVLVAAASWIGAHVQLGMNVLEPAVTTALVAALGLR